jgi:hypothetical protein
LPAKKFAQKGFKVKNIDKKMEPFRANINVFINRCDDARPVIKAKPFYRPLISAMNECFQNHSAGKDKNPEFFWIVVNFHAPGTRLKFSLRTSRLCVKIRP